MVKYCNRDCQIAHRPQHKKACKKRAAELYDEKLFKEVEPEECPICMLPLPIDANHIQFQNCCGKQVCIGCIYALAISLASTNAKNREDCICPYCRIPSSKSDEEHIKRLNKLMDKGNAWATNNFAGHYAHGTHGLSQDYHKANELWLKAGELGCAGAYYNLGVAYTNGEGVAIDEKKAKYYWELAAMNGNVQSRRILGSIEGQAGNDHRAFKHYTIAARAGDKGCLDVIKKAFEFKDGLMRGIVTKDEYAKTLRGYQKAQDDMKSDMRDKAATLDTIL